MADGKLQPVHQRSAVASTRAHLGEFPNGKRHIFCVHVPLRLNSRSASAPIPVSVSISAAVVLSGVSQASFLSQEVRRANPANFEQAWHRAEENEYIPSVGIMRFPQHNHVEKNTSRDMARDVD